MDIRQLNEKLDKILNINEETDEEKTEKKVKAAKDLIPSIDKNLEQITIDFEQLQDVLEEVNGELDIEKASNIYDYYLALNNALINLIYLKENQR